jgi:hypothetical protein
VASDESRAAGDEDGLAHHRNRRFFDRIEALAGRCCADLDGMATSLSALPA